MSKGYKARRNKLKSHDQGRNRHVKGVAHEDKKLRLTQQHSRNLSMKRLPRSS